MEALRILNKINTIKVENDLVAVQAINEYIADWECDTGEVIYTPDEKTRFFMEMLVWDLLNDDDMCECINQLMNGNEYET